MLLQQDSLSLSVFAGVAQCGVRTKRHYSAAGRQNAAKEDAKVDVLRHHTAAGDRCCHCHCGEY
jgi:hypothetical protein